MASVDHLPQECLDLFYSYAREDGELQQQLKKYLRMLEREGLIRTWDDRMIGAGSEWEGKILDALERADVILLLVSADFLSSDYCWDVEMKRALVRHRAEEAVVIPIILRPCPWETAPFAKLQCLPRDGQPIIVWDPQEEGYTNVAQGLRAEIVKYLATARKPPTPGAVVKQRALDAAIAKRVPVGRATDLVAMVRTSDSQGLKTILEVEDIYSARSDDVKSQSFDLDFPRNPSGELDVAEVTLQLESDDLDPPRQQVLIEIPPDRDSRTCVFLVTAKREGALLLKLNVQSRGVSLAQQLLRTNGHADMRRRTSQPYVMTTTFLQNAPPHPVPAPARAKPASPAPAMAAASDEEQRATAETQIDTHGGQVKRATPSPARTLPTKTIAVIGGGAAGAYALVKLLQALKLFDEPLRMPEFLEVPRVFEMMESLGTTLHQFFC